MQNIGLKSFDNPDYLGLKKIRSKSNFDLKFNFSILLKDNLIMLKNNL